MASATALMNRLQPLQLSAVAKHHRAAACICTSKSVMITRHLSYFQCVRRTIPKAIFTDNGAISIPVPMADLNNATANPAPEFNFNGRTQNNNEDSTRIPATTKTKSSILVIGLSVHTAPVEMREKLAIPAAEWPRAIQALCSLNHISEAAVLSTCNRMEIYVMALSWPRGISEVTDWISQNSGGVPAEDLKPHLFILRDTEAYQHLFQVSSGLDSLVLGEGQILAQLKQVYKIGHEVAGFGRHIGGLFKHAISAGKRVRTETSIAAGAISVSAAAVELAAMKLVPHDLTISSVNVMVVGAGKMGRLVIKHLVSKGCRKITVVNRTLDRVVRMRPEMEAAGVEIMYRPMHELMAAATEAPLIFTSTSSETPLFVKQDVEALLAAASGGSSTRIFIDIAVPRNVGACVSQVAGARLFNVDDLQEVVAANHEDREKKALEAQAIIDEELGRFEAWMDAQETVPTIKMLRAYADRIRSLELEKCLSKLEADSSPEKVKKLMEDLSRGILNKFLHGPMLHLRCDESEGRPLSKTIENMHAVQRMFDLEAPSS